MPLETDEWGNVLDSVRGIRFALTNYRTVVPAPVDYSERYFKERHLDFPSLAQLAFLRSNDFVADLSEFMGSSVTNTDVYHDEDRVVLVPDSGIRKLTGLADLVRAHKQGKEYVIPEDQRAKVIELVEEMLGRGAAFYAPHGITIFETSDFDKNDLTSRLFSDESLGIKSWPKHLLTPQI